MALFFSLSLSAFSESTALAWAVLIHESDSLLWQLLHFFRPSNAVSAAALPTKTVNNATAAIANVMGYFTGISFLRKTPRGPIENKLMASLYRQVIRFTRAGSSTS